MTRQIFGAGKMTLYHTSDREIRDPDIHYGRRNADFGWGFYLTPDRDFTYRWARDNAVVNEYELDETLKLLMIGPEYTQVAIKTEKAVKQLRFIRSEQIRKMSGEQRKSEQDAYQEVFAMELQAILNKEDEG